jgi:hypothetical protein
MRCGEIVAGDIFVDESQVVERAGEVAQRH